MNKQQAETKEYLSQAFRIDKRVQSKVQQIQSLNDLAHRVTTTYSDMLKPETRNFHAMEDAILAIIDLENEISRDVLSLIKTKRDIMHRTKAIEDTEHQTLLELRYLCYKSWEQIASSMNYELRWIYRLHHKALDAVYETSHQKPL